MKTLSTVTTTRGTGEEMNQPVGAKPETLSLSVGGDTWGMSLLFWSPCPTAGHKQDEYLTPPAWICNTHPIQPQDNGPTVRSWVGVQLAPQSCPNSITYFSEVNTSEGKLASPKTCE